MKLKLALSILAILWVGMILAIGMESIVKFSTPTLTKPVAFDVGRTVFSAFNHVQLGMLVCMIFLAFFLKLNWINNGLVAIIAIALLLQVFWLFPTLSQRVDMVLSGTPLAASYKHSVYGLLEILKMVALFILGVRLVV